MEPIIKEPWFSKQDTVVGVLKAVRDMYTQHPERYVENIMYSNDAGLPGLSSQEGATRACALGAIGLATGQLLPSSCPQGLLAVRALRAELPPDVAALTELCLLLGKRNTGINRGYGLDISVVATCSNLLGPAFIAAACDRAIAKLEPQSAGIANFVKPKVLIEEPVYA